MATGKRPKSFGEKNKVAKWDYNEVPPKSKWKGFIAGEPCGTFLHFEAKRSYPCLSMMTDQDLACPHCARGLVWEWRGYVPYYDAEYTRHFVLINDTYYESVMEIQHLSPITITRGNKKTDPVVVKYEPWRVTPIPHSEDRSKPVDLMAFLLRVLWKDQALLEHAIKQKGKDADVGLLADLPDEKKVVKTPADLEKELRCEEEARKLYGDEKADALQRAARNVFKVAPTANGHYKGPPKT